MSIYLNPKTGQTMDELNDVVPLEEWRRGGVGACGRHPDGFLVFVPSNSIEVSDEYATGDPYQVTKNIHSAFHKRRFLQTIQLTQHYNSSGPMRILDLGCGEGHLTQALKEAFSDSEVYGLDYSVSAIRLAHRLYPSIHFVVADAYQVPYQPDLFDVVILNNIWEHVPDPMLLLDRIRGVLKMDGAVVVSTPSRYRFSNLIRVLWGKPIAFMSKLHVTEYSVGQVKEQLSFGGFEVKRATSDSIREHTRLVHGVKKLIELFLRIMDSHHVLESTVFYLAVRRK